VRASSSWSDARGTYRLLKTYPWPPTLCCTAHLLKLMGHRNRAELGSSDMKAPAAGARLAPPPDTDEAATLRSTIPRMATWTDGVARLRMGDKLPRSRMGAPSLGS
jgi:hypothetical protein